VPTKNRYISPSKKTVYSSQKTAITQPIKKEETARMYMNLNTEIEQINRTKVKQILNTFLPKKTNIDIYN
jgi:membrane glycosyltransferase